MNLTVRRRGTTKIGVRGKVKVRMKSGEGEGRLRVG